MYREPHRHHLGPAPRPRTRTDLSLPAGASATSRDLKSYGGPIVFKASGQCHASSSVKLEAWQKDAVVKACAPHPVRARSHSH